MTRLHEATCGHRAQSVPIQKLRQLADLASLDPRDIDDALFYLAQKGLVELNDRRINTKAGRERRLSGG